MREHMRAELTCAALIELVHQRRWATREQARRDVFAYIEGYYNRQRLHSALGYKTPEQMEREAA